MEEKEKEELLKFITREVGRIDDLLMSLQKSQQEIVDLLRQLLIKDRND